MRPRKSPPNRRWRILFFGAVLLRQHTLMQDAHDENSIRALSIKHHVMGAFHAPQTRANRITRATQGRIMSEQPTALLQTADVTICLRGSPCAERVTGDLQ